jgi:hypothetical protein
LQRKGNWDHDQPCSGVAEGASNDGAKQDDEGERQEKAE